MLISFVLANISSLINQLLLYVKDAPSIGSDDSSFAMLFKQIVKFHEDALFQTGLVNHKTIRINLALLPGFAWDFRTFQ